MIRYNYNIVRYFISSFFVFSIILSKESQAGQLRYNTQEASYQGEGVSAHCYANGACTSSYSGPQGGDGSGGGSNQGGLQMAQVSQVMQTGAQMVDAIGDIQQISQARKAQQQQFEQAQKQFDEQEQLLDQEHAQKEQADLEAERQAKIEEKNQEEEQKHEEVMDMIQGNTQEQLPPDSFHTGQSQHNPVYQDPGNHTTSDQVTDRLPTIEEEKLSQLPSGNSDFKVIAGGVSGSQNGSSYEVKPSTAFFGIPGNPNVEVKPDLADESTSVVNTDTKFVAPHSAPIIPAPAPIQSTEVTNVQPGRRIVSEFTPDRPKLPQSQGDFFKSTGDFFNSLHKINQPLDKKSALKNAIAKASGKKEITGKDKCNYFVSEVGRSLDIPYFRRFGYHEQDDQRTASQMYSFLTKAIKDPKSGWEEVKPTGPKGVQALADEGEVVFAIARNKYAPDEISRGGSRVDKFVDENGKPILDENGNQKIAHAHIGIVAPKEMDFDPNQNSRGLPLIRDSNNATKSVSANYAFTSLSGKAQEAAKADPKKEIQIEEPIYVHWKGTR